ncbi:ATP-binding protein [Streptomyces albidoflavus]
MSLPVRYISGHLLWTTHGTTWAIWRVDAGNFSYAPTAARKRRLRALAGLFRALRGEPMLLSLCPQVDPTTVVRAMVADVDLDRSPRYEALGHAVLDELDDMELTGRTDWLALPLPPLSRADQIRSTLSAATAGLSQTLGLVPAPIPTGEVVQRREQADALHASWPTGINMRPATEAEILWIYGHSARRGLQEPFLPTDEQQVRTLGRTAAAHGDLLLAEGGIHDSRARAADPTRRRYLQVSSEWGDSYQALLALSEMPARFALPGAAYLQQLDDLAYPVDWSARLKIVPGHLASGKIRRRARRLRAQADEETSDPTSPVATSGDHEDDVVDYASSLAQNAQEVAIQAMVTLAVWGDTPEEAQGRAKQLASDFGATDYTFARPMGAQRELWEAMLPGYRTPRAAIGYAQHLLARDFALAMPWCGSQLGDDRGAFFGLQLASGGARPVLLDADRGPRENASGSMAFIGELGAGKSVGLKTAVYNVLARGRSRSNPRSRGRAVIVDRTKDEEWVRFTEACPGSTQVLRIDQTAAISLDPLRLYGADGAKKAARYTESFLTLLLGVRPMDLEGVALSEAVAAVLAQPNPSMSRLTEELARRGATDTASHTLARKLKAVAGKDLAAAVFDDTLPVADTRGADAVVFCVASLALPKKSELASEHRIERLEFEKVFGRALMYLIAAVARETTMASKDEFAVAVWDEAWWLTSSEEGTELLLELLRDGRKHRAAAYVGSHDADDIGPSDAEKGHIIRGLIPHRLVFRQTTRSLAARSLAFLGADDTDPDLLDLVSSLSPIDLPEEERRARAGEALYRDLSGRIGLMRVVIPHDPTVMDVIHTTPSDTA